MELRRPAGIVVLGLLLAGCGPHAQSPGTQSPPGEPPASTRPPSPAPTITVIKSGQVVPAGTTVPFKAQEGVSVRLHASRPSVSQQRLSSSYGYAPSHGYYVTFQITLVNTGRSPVDVGPSDFFVRVSRQGKVTTLMGNAPYSGASAQLDATQLDAGQSVSGPLTFDVRATHGTLAFAPDGSPAISWIY